MTLTKLTGKESGIIVYGDNAVGVFNFMECGENRIPILSPIGTPFPWPESEDVFEDVEINYCEDIRQEIPGSIWIVEKQEDGSIVFDTDLDIVYDINCDLHRLFLGKDCDPNFEPEYDLCGTVYTLKDGRKIITLDQWD